MNLTIPRKTKVVIPTTHLYEYNYSKIPHDPAGSVETEVFYNNERPLAQVYNEALRKYRGKHKIVVFIHDDVVINCVDWFSRVERALERFDVVGVAGAAGCSIKSPALWHLMSTKEQWRGAAAHPAGDTHYITSFGLQNTRALLIDGVFMAAKIDSLPEDPFDESCPCGFHFYDLDFSLTCNEYGLKLGVWDIPIIHQSPGLSEVTDDWRAGEKWFLNKWQSK